ncbi:Uncharacterized rhomboid protein AN10929 [Serendipita indica DSM 11827]|nr:Uncharacterized rhomboid protein AN10929 [Serendipita indica DSM 11827]
MASEPPPPFHQQQQYHQPPAFATQPVNFNDSHSDFFQRAPTDGNPTGIQHEERRTYNDRSSVLTGWTSGITVPYHSEKRDDGQTHAQAIANEYSNRASRMEPSATYNASPNARHSQALSGGGDRKSVGPDSAGLSYIDENFRYYSSRGTPVSHDHRRLDSPTDAHDAPLVSNAADMDGSGHRLRDLGKSVILAAPSYAMQFPMPPYDANQPAVPPEYAEPPSNNRKLNLWGKLVDRNHGSSLEQQLERRKRGIQRQRRPYVVWFLTVVMLAVMIYEIVENKRVTGSPFAFKPQLNPMIGPASIELITLGARFPPCMKFIPDVPPTLSIGCANATSTTLTSSTICTIEDVCGFGGFGVTATGASKEPNQWFRFITPIFLHAGIIHFLLNMFAQWVLSGQVEREMGSIGFFILYFACGVFGNILGGNFALVGQPSVGASGAIVGTLAVLWVDLIAHWSIEYKPVQKLIGHIINLVLVVGMGYIPGVDNFSHLGGLLMGLITGIILLPIISTTKRHKMIVWALRIAMIPLAIVLFVVLIRNFYTGDPSKACSWCRYLSCIPTANNNRCRGTGLTTTTISN